MFSFLPSLLRGWRAALLFVVVTCLTPERARAECGDHVTILPAKVNQKVNPDGQTVTPEARLPSVPAPCHGPNCSRMPERSLPPVAVAPLTPTATEATLASTSGQSPKARDSFARDHSSPEPIHRPPPVFHPPRQV